MLFIKEWGLIIVLLALGFMTYALSTVKPEKVKHQISDKGIKSGSKLYPWEALGRFWFDKKWQYDLLYIENFMGFPPRIMMVIDSKDKAQIQKILSQILEFEKPEKTKMEKAGDWLVKKFPLETNNHSRVTPSSKNPQK